MDAPALALTLPLTATQAPIEQGLKVERKDLRQAIKLTDSSNRVKFTCPRCKANAWGKPSLRIACLNPECEGAAFEGGASSSTTPSTREFQHDANHRPVPAA
jgi:ribosomal protein L37AE/L43A